MEDICRGRQIRVAFNQSPRRFEVDMHTGKMVQYPVGWSVKAAASGYGLYPYEILSTFVDAQQLSPIFIDNQQTWGKYDTEAEQWRGAVGMVRPNIIFIHIKGSFSYFDIVKGRMRVFY